MRCEQAGVMMSTWMDGHLDSTETLLLQEHLAACRRCQAEWQALAALDRLLGATPTVPAPATLRTYVMARLDRRQQARQAIIGGMMLATGTLALVLLLLAPLIPDLLNLGGILPALAHGGPETLAQLLTLLEAMGRTSLVLMERFAVPLAFLCLCGLAAILALNGLCIRAVRRVRTR